MHYRCDEVSVLVHSPSYEMMHTLYSCFKGGVLKQNDNTKPLYDLLVLCLFLCISYIYFHIFCFFNAHYTFIYWLLRLVVCIHIWYPFQMIYWYLYFIVCFCGIIFIFGNPGFIIFSSSLAIGGQMMHSLFNYVDNVWIWLLKKVIVRYLGRIVLKIKCVLKGIICVAQIVWWFCVET